MFVELFTALLLSQAQPIIETKTYLNELLSNVSQRGDRLKDYACEKAYIKYEPELLEFQILQSIARAESDAYLLRMRLTDETGIVVVRRFWLVLNKRDPEKKVCVDSFIDANSR